MPAITKIKHKPGYFLRCPVRKDMMTNESGTIVLVDDWNGHGPEFYVTILYASTSGEKEGNAKWLNKTGWTLCRRGTSVTLIQQ